MQLHGNAALSLNQRRRLAHRVVDEGWTLAEAAAAAEVSVRTAQKWAARYRFEGTAASSTVHPPPGASTTARAKNG